MNISWVVPPRKHWNGNLLGYNIRVVTKEDSAKVLIDQNVSAKAYTVSLNTSSFDGKDVDIQLAAYNKAGIGTYSEPLVILNSSFIPFPPYLCSRFVHYLYFVEDSVAGGAKGKEDGGSPFKVKHLVYVALGLVTVVLVGAVLVIWVKNRRRRNRHGGRGTRMRILVCSEEKTYTGSMGSQYPSFYF